MERVIGRRQGTSMELEELQQQDTTLSLWT